MGRRIAQFSSRLLLIVGVALACAGLAAAPAAFGGATVGVSGTTLTVTAAPGVRDNVVVSRPSSSRLRVTDLPSGPYTGGAVSAGTGCTQSGARAVNCAAAGVTRVSVSSGDRPDRVVNSTGVRGTLNGGAANDTLIGGSAKDTLTGGPGPDALKGRNGSDLLLARDGTSEKTIDCDGGTKPGSADEAELDQLPRDPGSAVKGCETIRRPGGLYVALGDSVAGFVGLLYSDYQASLGVSQLLNLHQGGATSGDLRTGQLPAALTNIGAASDTKAVTIEIGGNDALGGCLWDQPGCAFRDNFAYILGALKAALAADPGTERFTTMVYYNPASGTGTSREADLDATLLGDNLGVGCSDSGADLGLNDVIAQEAGSLGIPVADPYPAFKQHGQAYMADPLHPNAAGYAAIAQAFHAATVPCGP